MDAGLTEDVLERLGVAGLANRPTPDVADLRRVYAAWCEAVPFDNVLKMIHIAEGRGGLLPGSTAEDFFASWLQHRNGGASWGGDRALHAPLARPRGRGRAPAGPR